MRIVETEKYTIIFADNQVAELPVENTDVIPPTNEPEQVKDDSQTSPIPKGTEVWWRYGNYCGPGPLRTKTCDKLINGKPLPGAKDEVDQACMDHDLEYCQNGLGWRDAYLFELKSAAATADQELIRKLKKLYHSPSLNWKQKMASVTIIAYFSMRSRVVPMSPKSQGLPSSGNG